MSTANTASPPSSLPPTTGQEYTRRAHRMSAVWAVIVVVVAVAAGLGGFYYGKSQATNSSTVTVTYYDDLAPSEASFMTGTQIPQFESQYPNIHINYINLDASDMVTKIEALVQAGSVGTTLIAEDNLDIGELIYGPPVAGGSGNMTYLENISALAPYIEPPTMIPSMTAITNYEPTAYNGATYFIPFRANVPLTFVNWTTLNSAGITTFPANTGQLMGDAAALYNTTGSGQVMYQGGDLAGASTSTETFQWDVQFGGNPMVFNDAGDVAAMSYLYNLSQYMNPGYKTAYWGTYGGLANGQYSLLDYQWPYIYPLLVAGNSSVAGMSPSVLGVYPGPNGTSPTYGSDHVVGGDVLAIPKGATNLWAIQIFAQFLLSTKAQQEMMVTTSNPAVNAAAYNGLPSSLSVINEAILAALENPVFRPPVPWIGEWNDLFFNDIWQPVILSGGGLSQIVSDSNAANSQMVSYLTSNYGSATAAAYSAGDYGPLYV
jgi:trehalose transport system substrate-binding protein